MDEKNAKKYEFTGETREFVYSYDGTLKPGKTVLLHRIRALRDIEDAEVYEGYKGGWIESEKNLSQDGDCWVGDGACVFGKAVVEGDAEVSGRAVIKGNAVICGHATVTDNAKVGGYAVVSENASVCDYAIVYAHVTLARNVSVQGTADLTENIFQNRNGKERATVKGDFTIRGYIVEEEFGQGWVSLAVDDNDFWADEEDEDFDDYDEYEDDDNYESDFD